MTQEDQICNMWQNILHSDWKRNKDSEIISQLLRWYCFQIGSRIGSIFLCFVQRRHTYVARLIFQEDENIFPGTFFLLAFLIQFLASPKNDKSLLGGHFSMALTSLKQYNSHGIFSIKESRKNLRKILYIILCIYWSWDDGYSIVFPILGSLERT